MSRKLITDLRALKLAHPRSGDPDALFWPGTELRSPLLDYDRPLDTGSILRHRLRPAAEAAGVPARMHFHDLRRTYASLILAAGFKPYEVSRWMGHGSVAVTDGIYGHLYPADYDQQMDRFEQFVANG